MLQIDLAGIAADARAREEENMKFREFLKRHSDLEEEELDGLVGRVTLAVASQIDCHACGECCKRPPTIEEPEIASLAAAAGMDEQEFRGQCVATTERGQLALVTPCPFLRQDGGRTDCAAGDAKPIMCRDYPYLLRPGIVWRLLGVVQRYGECPIVYYVYEQLKRDLAAEFTAAEPAIDEYWDWEDE